MFKVKQTAGNNKFLAVNKRIWNGKIYKRLAGLLNTFGPDEAVAYLRTHTKNPTDYNNPILPDYFK